MIRAEVHSDDHTVEAKFDAEPWFAQASNEEIIELAECDWGHDYPADDVARFFGEEDAGVKRLFEYMSFEPTHYGERVGFECHVDSEDATRWVSENRPHLLVRIVEGE